MAWHGEENHLLSSGETAAWFSWTGQSYAGMSADRAVMSGHTLSQTHSTDVWERLGSRKHSVGHGWPHTSSHTMYILGEIQLFSSFKCPNGRYAQAIRSPLCIPHFFSSLSCSCPPTFHPFLLCFHFQNIC